MTWGIRTWDEFGNLVMDVSTRCGRIIGLVDPGPNAGSIVVPEFVQGTPFPSFLNPFAINEFNSGGAVYGFPIVTISGLTMSWTYERGAGMAPAIYQGALIAYGVY